MITDKIKDIYKLSPMQEGMLFHSLIDPEVDVYFIHLTCVLHGQLNEPAFKRAWQTVLNRHAVLRTAFEWETLEKPLQIVYGEIEIPLAHLDWRNQSDEQQQRNLEDFLKADKSRGFSLSVPPLMRLALMRMRESVYQFVWSFHHLLLDGWSKSVILNEVFRLYEGYCRDEEIYLEPPRIYRDYIALLQQQDIDKANAFWQETLKGFTAATPLPADVTPSILSGNEPHYDEHQVRLSVETTEALQSLARWNGLTLNTFIQGAWAILLSRSSGEQDIVFGVTVSGRPPSLAGAESMIGVFINTLPIRAQVSPDTPLLSWLEALQEQQSEMREYEYSPLLQVQMRSDIPRGESLFESILVFENYPADATAAGACKSISISDIRFIEKTNYPLTLIVAPGQQLLLWLVYDCRHFTASTAARILAHLRALLESMIAAPRARLSDLRLLTESEQHQLLFEWNDNDAPALDDQCVHELFEAQAEIIPDAVAIVGESQHLTYKELNARANQLSSYLQTFGVGPDVPVGICLERSADVVIAMLGALKAGGAYMALDPAYPKERRGFMLEDARSPALITNSFLADDLLQYEGKVILLDRDSEEIFSHSRKQRSNAATAENFTYVIYTSGSTGKPKGSGLPHRALVNLLRWAKAALKPASSTLHYSSISFDVSFFEIFSTLGFGGTIRIVPEAVRLDITELGRLFAEAEIEKAVLPVVILQQLAERFSDNPQCLNTLIEVITTGEQMQITKPVIDLFHQLKNSSLRNHYGPSETHVVTDFALDQDPNAWMMRPPIGRPISNTQIYLLDRQYNPAAIGTLGELFIGGVSLARCYLDRADLTAEKFIPDLFASEPGARLYRTGDLARYTATGEIEFFGRIDHQLKIHGFRVEPGEIESVLSHHSGVRETAVLAQPASDGHKRLVAYVVADEDAPPSITDLRNFLKQFLPDYLTPSIFVFLDALPLTPNGKVDRRKLPVPTHTRAGVDEEFVAPVTAAEQAVAAIWIECLDVDSVGIYDNFFKLGGHSILGMRVVNQLRQIFQVDLPLRSLWANPTVHGIISEIAALRGGIEVVEEVAAVMNEINRLSSDELTVAISKQRTEMQEGS